MDWMCNVWRKVYCSRMSLGSHNISFGKFGAAHDGSFHPTSLVATGSAFGSLAESQDSSMCFLFYDEHVLIISRIDGGSRAGGLVVLWVGNGEGELRCPGSENASRIRGRSA